MFFDRFALDEAGPVRMRSGGSGPALLLLHGQLQTHAMWHEVAVRLADRFTLICPDLPAGEGRVEQARSMLALMDRLGHSRFGLAGHDMGGHVACRMALAAPDRVRRLAVLGIAPPPAHGGRGDMAYALAMYPSCWFAQLHPKPEALVNYAPDDWFSQDLARGDAPFHPAAVADYLRFGAPAKEDRDPSLMPSAQSRIPCEMLAIWGREGRLGGWYDPLQLWRELCAGGVSGGAVPGGHFLAEESPGDVADALAGFFAEDRQIAPAGRQGVG